MKSLLIALLTLTVVNAAYTVHTVYVINIEGYVTKAASVMIHDVILKASKTPNSAILITLRTPGGELDAALKIVSDILNSRVPVITYVYPRGSYAWSAGTLILLSGKIAAMSPGTVIGSCQPVIVNPITGEVKPVKEDKVLNAIERYFMEIARMRGRNETFASLCVRRNLNLGAEEALRDGVIDVIANNIYDLLNRLNESVIGGMRYIIIRPKVIYVKPSIWLLIYNALQDPVVWVLLQGIGLLLIMVGALTGHYAISAIGALLISLPLLGGLPINWLSLALMILGVSLIIAEAISGFSTHGVLTAMGIVFSALGVIMALGVYRPPEWLIREIPPEARAAAYSAAAAIGLIGGVIAVKAIATLRRSPISESLYRPIGEIGISIDDIPKGMTGMVKVRGEYWRAITLEDVKQGQPVKIIDMRDDGVLIVRPLKGEDV